MRLLADGPRPVQIILAGKAHPQDKEAKETIRRRFELRRDAQVARRMVFLEDYDLHMAPRVMAGVDVWLNLPRPPLEASGTSGMKIALNGGLNVSVLDGWWAEAYDGQNGWAIETPTGDPYQQTSTMPGPFSICSRVRSSPCSTSAMPMGSHGDGCSASRSPWPD